MLEVLAQRGFPRQTLEVRPFKNRMERDASTGLRRHTGTTANAGATAASPGSLTAARPGRVS